MEKSEVVKRLPAVPIIDILYRYTFDFSLTNLLSIVPILFFSFFSVSISSIQILTQIFDVGICYRLNIYKVFIISHFFLDQNK